MEGLTNQAEQIALNAKLKQLSQVKPIPADQQLDYTYTGDFDITFYQQQLLQLQLTGYNYPAGAAHGMPTMIYAIINLTNGQLYELKDLFKPNSDYVKVLSQIVGIRSKMILNTRMCFRTPIRGLVGISRFCHSGCSSSLLQPV